MANSQSEDLRENPFRSPQTISDPEGERAGLLPPTLVKVFSVFFSLFLIAAIAPLNGGFDSVMFLGFNFTPENAPKLFVNIVGVLLLLGAISGIAILLRRRLAYDIACFYCFCTVSAAAVLHFTASAQSVNWINGSVQYPLLAWFTYHTFSNRRRWRQQHSSSIK